MKVINVRLFCIKLTLVSCTGLASCHGDTEDGVGSQVVLVLTAVKLEHELIDGSLKKF